ncbi:acyl-CoA carboxylase epsilon subunit [Streptomyces sp. NPDC058674]|uniref:acyl-CoA carboxylase epsilon subunit n=1 Tax=Streptomyces sp. NPDC058674 TaxID=3346592 RepID=UPI003647D887
MSMDAATAPTAQPGTTVQPDPTVPPDPAAQPGGLAPTVAAASLIRVERGVAAPEELAAIAVVVACYARRTGNGHDAAEPKAAGPGHRGRRAARADAGCWAGCWACR